MPPSKVHRSVIIIFDIGRNVAESEDKKTSFFEKSRECIAKIIERKILSQSQNSVGIILLGSTNTNNNMAEQSPGLFKRIELVTEVQNPTWEMIRNLPKEPSKKKGDWLEALIVAADHYKNGIVGTKISEKKVILITNFAAAANLDNILQMVADGFKEDMIEIDVLGLDLYEDHLKNEDIEAARLLVEETKGVNASFDFIMRYLLFNKKKNNSSHPWNVDLSIGPNIKIPVSVYIRLRDEPVIKTWKKAVKNPVSLTASSSEGIIKEKFHINVENQKTVDPLNIIKGCQYGQQVIPFTDSDKSMLYESGEKCLSVYGFTPASNITWQNLNGDGLHYVFGRKGDKNAGTTIRCLAECLQKMKLYGVVRRVYNKGNAPKMFVLMPVIDSNNFFCLSMAGICFKNEVKLMKFPKTHIKKYSCTVEQVNAFKDLVKAMDLTKAYDSSFDDTEAFPIAETVSPIAQYMMDSIAFRAMNPGKPLPPPRDDIMMLFKVPATIEKKAQDPLKKIKSLFTLEEVEVKQRKKIPKNDISTMSPETQKVDDTDHTDKKNNASTMPKIYLPTKEVKIKSIGTSNPVGDCKVLINSGKNISDIASSLTEVVENLIYINLDRNYCKAFDTLAFFREECVNTDPEPYNKWLVTFKTTLLDRKKINVIDLLVEKKLDVILKNENSRSKYDLVENSEDSQLYENDTIPYSTEIKIESEINDIFDEM